MSTATATSGIGEKIAAKMVARRTAATVRYMQLLRLDNLDEAETDELLGLLSTVGRTVEDAGPDAELLRRADTLVQLVKAGPELLADQAKMLTELRAVDATQKESTERILREADEARKAVAIFHKQQTSKLMEARAAEKELDSLLSKLSAVFGTSMPWASVRLAGQRAAD